MSLVSSLLCVVAPHIVPLFHLVSTFYFSCSARTEVLAVLHTLIKYQSGPLLLSHIEDTEVSRLGLTAGSLWISCRCKGQSPLTRPPVSSLVSPSDGFGKEVFAKLFEAGTASFPGSLEAAAFFGNHVLPFPKAAPASVSFRWLQQCDFDEIARAAYAINACHFLEKSRQFRLHVEMQITFGRSGFASSGYPAAGKWSGAAARGMSCSALRRFVLVPRLATSWEAAHPQDKCVCHCTENSVCPTKSKKFHHVSQDRTRSTTSTSIFTSTFSFLFSCFSFPFSLFTYPFSLFFLFPFSFFLFLSFSLSFPFFFFPLFFLFLHSSLVVVRPGVFVHRFHWNRCARLRTC